MTPRETCLRRRGSPALSVLMAVNVDARGGDGVAERSESGRGSELGGGTEVSSIAI